MFIFILGIQVPSIVLPMDAMANAWCSFTYLSKYLGMYNTRIKPQISPPPLKLRTPTTKVPYVPNVVLRTSPAAYVGTY